jgi:hypothetical protein
MACRLKIINVAESLVSGFLRDGLPALEVESGALPADAILVALHFDGRTIRLTYRSKDFPDVPRGELIPELVVMLRTIPR